MNKRTKPPRDLLDGVTPAAAPSDVAAVRIDTASEIATDQPAEPTPHERRAMLVNGTEDFMLNVESIDPAKARQLAEESVDASIAKGIVTLNTPQHDDDERAALAPPPEDSDAARQLADQMAALPDDQRKIVQGAIDQCRGAILRMQEEREAQTPPPEFDWSDSENVVLHDQPETAVYFNPKGALVIRQRADWNEENDPFVYICPNNIAEFIDKLCDVVGIPSVGRQ